MPVSLIMGNFLNDQLRELPQQTVARWAQLHFSKTLDSLDWLDLAAEVESQFGVRLMDEAIPRIQSAEDLAREITSAPPSVSRPKFDTAPVEYLGTRSRYWLDPLTPGELAASWFLDALNRIVMRTVFRLQVTGKEFLPSRGQFILAPHHSSYLDPFVLAAALEFGLLKQTYWATCVRLAFGPLAKVLRRMTHAIPVDSQLGAAASLAYGLAVLQRGQNLVWFPEGRLSPSGSMLPLAGGLGVLLARNPVPVVPVLIRGTFEALPLGRTIPRPTSCQVIFAPPLDYEKSRKHGSERSVGDQITARLQSEMQRLFDE
jgi:long-chain acyl-CoA synthetase